MSDTPSATTEIKLPKDLAAEKGLVNVQINGVWHQFPKGTRMIEACRQAETLVPHYCYHPKLSSPGNCRMCLVQMGMPGRPAPGEEPKRDENGYEIIGWMPRPVIACANTIGENMGIRTQGELVEKCREGVMEFLLINHPLDCPICDQAGECRLQEHSVDHGRGTSRFVDMKVKKPKNVDIGPRIRLDDERCIMCSRCIRFMDEVAGDPVLGFTQRGTHTTLTVHPGRLLDSNYSLNTADICPVGALTSNDFRFQMRVWFLKETNTIDVNCGTGTNIVVWTRGNTVYRITPRQNDAVNSNWMPDSHRLNFHYINSDARLTEPLSRSLSSNAVPQINGNTDSRLNPEVYHAPLVAADGTVTKIGDDPDTQPRHQTGAVSRHVATTWTDALATAATVLRTIPAYEVAIIASGRMTNEELFLTKILADKIGTQLLTLIPRSGEADHLLVAADRNPNTTGAKLIFGTDDPFTHLGTIFQRVRSGSIKALIVLNEDIITDARFTAEDLSKVKLIVHTHALANPTAEAAHIVLPSAAFTEKRGSMINLSGRIQRLNRANEAPGLARDDWEILRDLITALTGEKSDIFLIEDLVKHLAEAVPQLNGMTLSKIGHLGTQLFETGYEIPLLTNERARQAAGIING